MLAHKTPEPTNIAETALTLEKLRKALKIQGAESTKMFVYDKNGNKVIL